MCSRPPRLSILVALLLGLAGCAGPAWSGAVTGDEQLLTHPAPQEAVQQENFLDRAEALRIERVRQAPKRTALAPIIVALIGTELRGEGAGGAAGGDRRELLFASLRAQFANHPVIALLPQNRVDEGLKIAEWSGARARIPADVVVHTFARYKQALGITTGTREFGPMRILVLEARVVSSFLPDVHLVEKQGDALAASELIEDFAAAIKQVIVAEIGPEIPADANYLRHPDNRTELDNLRGWLGMTHGARLPE